MSIQENPAGGRRQQQEARFDLIPYEALRLMALAFAGGEAKYGRLDSDPTKPNWTGLDITGEQSPVSHALKHLALYVSGVTTDPETGEPENHLGHALANLVMMAWFVTSPGSPHCGKTYPEILASGYEKGDGDGGDESEDVSGDADKGDGGGGDESEDVSGDSRINSGDTDGGDPVASNGGYPGISETGTAGITWFPSRQALHSTSLGKCRKQLAAEGTTVAAGDGRSG